MTYDTADYFVVTITKSRVRSRRRSNNRAAGFKCLGVYALLVAQEGCVAQLRLVMNCAVRAFQ